MYQISRQLVKCKILTKCVEYCTISTRAWTRYEEFEENRNLEIGEKEWNHNYLSVMSLRNDVIRYSRILNPFNS